MKKILILTINGSVYVFNRDQLNDKTIQTIKNYTKEIDEKNLKFDTYDEACNFFVYKINQKLGIKLHQVCITDVIRINLNTN